MDNRAFKLIVALQRTRSCNQVARKAAPLAGPLGRLLETLGLPPRSGAMSTNEPPTTTPVPPGGRAALPEGRLPKPFLGPQGDENRDPPANAPAPVPPTDIVVDVDDHAGQRRSLYRVSRDAF